MKEKHALIIATEIYQDTKIPTVQYASNDAEELASIITEHGYLAPNVTLMVNNSATKTRIESALRTRFYSLRKDDELLFFYAGHGFSSNGNNYITCYDTVLSDLPATSIPLQVLFSELHKSKCQKIVLFLDCCHSGVPINEGMRDLLSDMTDKEFQGFCKDSRYHIVFSSCASDEVSYSSSSLKHGIWTYHVIEALKGTNRSLLDRNVFLTATSLQNHLSMEVPRTLRRTFNGAERQTPRFWGNLSREAILADFTDIFNKRETKSRSSLAELKRASFWGAIQGAVKSLSGFKKFHKVPDDVNNATRNFVQKIGKDDVTHKANTIFDDLRTSLEYTRREIDLDEGENAVSILTPDFTVNVCVDIDENDPSQYVLCTEVCDIRKPAILEQEAFAWVFDKYFDRIIIEFNNQISIENIIDKIEKRKDRKTISVDYPPDISKCTVIIEGFPAELLFDSRKLTLKVKKRSDVNLLLGLSKQLPKLFSENKIFGLLSN